MFLFVITSAPLRRLRRRVPTASPPLLPVLPGQVVEQGLTPEMAIRACNNPRIRGDALSRAVAKHVSEHAKAEYARRRSKRRPPEASPGAMQCPGELLWAVEALEWSHDGHSVRAWPVGRHLRILNACVTTEECNVLMFGVEKGSEAGG